MRLWKFYLTTFFAIMVFANAAWGDVYTRTYQSGSYDTTFFGNTSLQNAISRANSDATIDSIYYHEDGGFQVASGDTFVITASDLNIVYSNYPECSDGFWITGDNIHMCGVLRYPRAILKIDTDDQFGILIDADNCIIEDCDIEADAVSSYGIYNHGDNNDMKYLTIHDCSGGGIISNGDDAYIYKAIISNCGIYGIISYGSGYSMEVEKALISDCDNGCRFSDDIYAEIDRTTIYDFDTYGIYNEHDADSVHCKRCLVYNTGGFGDGDYCYVRVYFDDVWSPQHNDNVAFGPGVYGHDTLECTGFSVAREADVFVTANIDSFHESTANIHVDDYYDIGDWGAFSDTSAQKTLCDYVFIPFPIPGGYHYQDNVGYDTLLTMGVGKESVPREVPDKPMLLSACPNPFNAAVNIEAPDDARMDIYDLSGKMVAELPVGKSKWLPQEDTESGVYLVRAMTNDGRAITKNIVYLK